MGSEVQYLLSLQAVRERSELVWQAARSGDLSHFDFHEDRLGEAADFVVGVIKVYAQFLA